LGTELAGALVACGSDRRGLDAIHATVAAANAASLTVLARVGFQCVKEIPEEDDAITVLLTLHRRDWTR
jgi:RimJ/RimL family protein N-acetyltransferase